MTLLVVFFFFTPDSKNLQIVSPSRLETDIVIIISFFFAVELRDSQRRCPSAPARKTGLGAFVFVGRPIASETGRPGTPPTPLVYCITRPGGEEPVGVELSPWRRRVDGVSQPSLQEVAEITPPTVPAGGGRDSGPSWLLLVGSLVFSHHEIQTRGRSSLTVSNIHWCSCLMSRRFTPRVSL